ncbi:MAG: T9SS type A sorting domain-containing protein, partial [Bacteroidetes bacterium]|nr:T9SS type A sorting domain-containing protein [Bacteroidota bacterium]
TLAQLAEIQHATTWWADTQFFTPTSEVDGCRFQISPNPVQDFLNVAWEDCTLAPQKFTLLDVAGRTVQTAEADGPDARFDVRGLANGVYFLKMESPAGSWVEKVVVE